MRITALEIFHVDADWRNWVFLRLTTDTGLTGIGEAGAEGEDYAGVAMLEQLRPSLLGADPRDIGDLVRRLRDESFWKGVVFLSALGGIEMACWDILGKSLGVPAHRLLGGPVRDRIPAYTHISEAASGHSVEERADEARAAVKEGWSAMKWDPLPAGHASTLTAPEVRHVRDQVEAVRDALGPDREILLDLHGRLDPHTAIRVAEAVAPYRPYFLEEPVPPGHVDELSQVTGSMPTVPFATGERILSREDWWPVLERSGIEFAQPDVVHVGGLGELRAIASMAETRRIRFAPHNPNGPVATAAALHVAAVAPNLAVFEMPADDYLWAAKWRDELLQDATPVRAVAGYLPLPAKPGLGIELDDAALAKHAVRRDSW